MKKTLLALLLLCFVTPAFASDKAPDEIWARVEKSRTLRCAYTIYPPFFMKDPNTGAFSGLSYDMAEELGKQLGLKIEWAADVSPDGIFEGFKSGRYDAVCLGYAQTPSRAWGGDFSKPFMFIPFNLYVRADETRFKSLDDFNKESVVIATLDGEMSQIVRREDFPLATEKSLPGITLPADRLEMVATGKADATAMEPDIATEYMKHNPGKIKMFGDKPLRMQGGTILIPHDEFRLKAFINAGLDTMLWDGAMERLIKKHQKSPGGILLPVQTYKAVEMK